MDDVKEKIVDADGSLNAPKRQEVLDTLADIQKAFELMSAPKIFKIKNGIIYGKSTFLSSKNKIYFGIPLNVFEKCFHFETQKVFSLETLTIEDWVVKELTIEDWVVKDEYN